MSRKRANKSVARSGTERAASRRGSLPRLLMLILAGLALATGVFLVRRGASVRPPDVATAGFEPIIAAQIEKALAEVRTTPRSGPAWGRLGMVLQAHEFTTEARFCFAQAERWEDREARWPYFHALLLSHADRDAAIAKLRRAAELSRGDPDTTRLVLAQSLVEAGRFDEAEDQFKQLLNANSNHAPARLGLAESSNARGRHEESRTWLQNCLSNAFTAKRAHTLLAKVERQLARSAAAEAAILTAAQLPPDRPWPDPFSDEAALHRIGRKAWVDQGQQLLQQHRHDEAQSVLARLVKEYPDAAEGWLLLGRLRMERGDCAGAEQALRLYLQRAPDSVNGHAQLGMALLCLERHAEAVAVLQGAVQLKPDFGEAHFNLGFALARAGRGREAIPSFRSAIRFSPEFVDAYITLADLLIQSGQPEEALNLLQRAQQLNPSDERVKLLMERARR